MSRWPRGEAEIEQLIVNKQLQQVIGGQANGAHLLQKAFAHPRNSRRDS